MRVLICDDHAVFADSFAQLLEVNGVRVVEVTYDLNQAVRALRRKHVDVCLLDVMFGAQNALGRLSDLRRAAPQIRIVLITGYVDSPLLEAGRVGDVQGIADKRQPVSEIVSILERAYIGGKVMPSNRAPEPRHEIAPRPRNYPQHLAAFLTPREREVVSALVRGTGTMKIARMLGISQVTVRCHIQSALTKMGAHSRLELVAVAVRYGMVDPESGEWLIPRR